MRFLRRFSAIFVILLSIIGIIFSLFSLVRCLEDA